MMVESEFPFSVFKSQNFEPTPIKLVVTAADTENRIVYELNAEPAAREYASAIGLLPDDLGPFSFASYPLVVKVGGDYYCRSIRNMNADGSLSFFCAIDEGLVFTVARPQDMLRATASVLEELDVKLGGIDLVVGFDCILRRLDAENAPDPPSDGRALPQVFGGRLPYLRRAVQRHAFEPDLDRHRLRPAHDGKLTMEHRPDTPPQQSQTEELERQLVKLHEDQRRADAARREVDGPAGERLFAVSDGDHAGGPGARAHRGAEKRPVAARAHQRRADDGA